MRDLELEHLEWLGGCMEDGYTDEPERDELTIEERLAHPKCHLEGSERLEQIVASAAAAYYGVNAVSQIQERK